MLKAIADLSCLNEGSPKKSETKSSSDGLLATKDVCVRVVHAGGRAELYHYAVPAYHLMEKYRGTCVARPEVFRNPLESILSPDEVLLTGHKYYIIPKSTARKLMRGYIDEAKIEDSGVENDVDITWELNEDGGEGSVCSAKDFYASKDAWTTCRMKKNKGVRSVKQFVPPLPTMRSFRGFGWEPSLSSVLELSP